MKKKKQSAAASAPKKHDLSESKEDYLEAIFHIEKENKVARVKEIAEAMGVRMPSVSGALKSLGDAGLIDHGRYGYVELTEEGRELAGQICARHQNISEFLIRFLDIDRATADKDACRIEHAVSPITFARLSKLVDFLEEYPREAEKILDRFKEFF